MKISYFFAITGLGLANIQIIKPCKRNFPGIHLLLFLLLLQFINPFQATSQELQFTNYSAKDGLPMNSVLDITQDNLGFMWFATEEGLARFDGYTFKMYNHDPDNPESIRGTNVLRVFTSSSGTIFASGDLYLDSYDPRTEIFQHMDLEAGVSCFFEDSKGNVWIGTYDTGIRVWNPIDSTFIAYQQGPGADSGLKGNFVTSIYEDNDGTIWIANGCTLQALDLTNGTFHHYPINACIYSILEDDSGTIWLCDSGGAIIALNKEDSSTVYHLINEKKTDNADDGLKAMIKDTKGNIWLGTSSEGLNLFDSDKGQFKSYKHDSNDSYSISSNTINDIYEDRAGNIWIATARGGVSFLRADRQPFTIYRHNPYDPESLSANDVISFFERPNGDIWVSTFGGGLNLFNRRDKIFTSFPAPDWGNNSGKVLEDSEGNVWFGSGNRFIAPDINNMKNFGLPPTESMLEDYNGNIWIAFDGGLAKFAKGKDDFIYYTHYDSIENSLSHRHAMSLYEDKKQRIWIGTLGGMDIYNSENDNFIHFDDHPTYDVLEDQQGNLITLTGDGNFIINTESDNQSPFILFDKFDFTITGALLDNKGAYWFPTKKGSIFKINQKIGEQIEFDYYKGDAFHYKSQLLSSTGEMYFGGINGFIFFHPDSIIQNSYVPPIVITDFRLFSQSVSVAGTMADTAQWQSPLGEGVAYTKEITLPYDYNIFSLEFTALDYTRPERNQYKYKLAGFNDDWVFPPSSNRIATYTNLSPGEYVFTVTGSNEAGVWNEEGVSISITVLPPWWLTMGAKTGYILTFIGVVWGFIYLRTHKQKRKLKEAEQLNTKLQQIDKLKDQFLANTSHELRTPLQGIIGLSESLVDGVAGKLSSQANDILKMVATSGKRLSFLVNDILDFSKLKNHQLSLQKRPVDIHSAADVVLTIAGPLVRNKDIKLINNIPSDLPLAEADENRLQQIFQNLVGNAVKFTDHGSVAISARASDHHLEVTVSDTGIGISEDKLDIVFHEFEQADGTTARKYGGTGLGLSVTKQLVELHGGSIHVKSEVDNGSHFTFTLPLSNTEREKLPDLKFAEGMEESVQTLEVESMQDIHDEEPEAAIVGDQVRILVVDDEPVNLEVLKNHLTMAGYQVTLANDGMEALEILKKEEQFDLIILDVMMPRLSGFEVCGKLREMFLPSELPVVMLTAKNRITDLVEGFSAGANDYLTKPFSKQELLSRIKVHLQLHRIHKATGKFVPFEFLRYLGRDSIVDVQLGDQTHQEVTILFCDIRGYTSISEEMSPEDNFKFINSFVGRMGPIIKLHQGFINQYMGDAIMAIFPKDVAFGLKAAIEMEQNIDEFNMERIEKGRKPFQVGIGLHTGPLIMGIIGDETRSDPSTISDTVNIASRMEGMTKYYGTRILISDDSYQSIMHPEDFHFRYMGEVVVKGKKLPVKVYECFDGDEGESIKKKIDTLSDFEEGLKFYFARDFPEASVIFNNIVKLHPEDLTAQHYYKLAIKYAGQGVADDWTGVEKLDRK